MSTMASQITSFTIVYSTVYSGTDQRKHQSSASLAFVRGIHLSPVNSPHKGPVTRKMFPFDEVIMTGLIGPLSEATMNDTNDTPVTICLKAVARHLPVYPYLSSLQWHHNECDDVSDHQPHDCLLNRLFRRKSKKTLKLHVTGLCVVNSPVTGDQWIPLTKGQ